MILAFLIGFGTGWAISMPVGPVNAASIMRTLHYGAKHGAMVGIGAAIMDIIYCAGATQINEFLLRSPIINLSFQGLGMLLLIYLGIKSLKVKREQDKEDVQHEKAAEQRVQKLHVKKGSILASLALGIILYASNIASLPEWVFLTAFWKQQGFLNDGFTIYLVFAIGAGLGTAGWFLTLTRYFSKRKSTLKPKTLVLINKVAGIAMLGFGLYFGYQIAFKTDWSKVNERWHERVGEILLITN
jgi:L-lysine exporter family protein LysE/ArgO